MRKLASSFLILGLLLSACSEEPEKADETPVERDLDRLDSELEDGVLKQTNEIPGEPEVVLEMNYSTDYDVDSWRITDSKTLRFGARLASEVPAGYTVLIEHVHVDVNLDARKAGFDGLAQDSMDDGLHTGADAGFYITSAYPYEEVFSIEGFSESLISGWGHAVSGTGSSEIEEERLTEGHLREHGKVTGNKFTFIYDILIRTTPDEPFHKRVVVDEFIVPVG